MGTSIVILFTNIHHYCNISPGVDSEEADEEEARAAVSNKSFSNKPVIPSPAPLSKSAKKKAALLAKKNALVFADFTRLILF